MLSPGRTLELLECTSIHRRRTCASFMMIKLKGQVLPLGFDICSPLSAVGEPEGAVASNHPDIMGLVQVGWRLQVSMRSDEIPQDQSILKSCQSFPR